jgi:S1-C subfamily serine protease
MPREMIGERIAAELGFVVRGPEAPDSPVPAVAVVMRGSPAEQAGLEAGDVILQVNDRAVLSREEAREALAESLPERPVRLTVRRGTAPIGHPERP